VWSLSHLGIVAVEFNFLLLHYLKSCPFPDVAEALERHLATERLLPERVDWQGQRHALSYGELVRSTFI
jgi:hypothetical protein